MQRWKTNWNSKCFPDRICAATGPKREMRTAQKGQATIMKSLAELQAIRDKAKAAVNLRDNGEVNTRVLVGMATCGIAAGARPVLNAFVEGINAENLGEKVAVSQTGCIGICQYEPVVEVYEKDKEKVTYVKMTTERAKEVIEKHIKGGKPIAEYTIGATNIAK